MPLPFQRRPRRPRRPRPISNWILFWAFAVVLAGGWLYYRVQVGLIDSIEADGSAEHDIAVTQLRVDTVRNTLTVAAGLGGAAALVLSFRRQQHDEYHSTQQRITELRIQAVAQLGSESPTVRIGGLHNLERLGEEHEELRQIVLDEVCAYLRMPYEQKADAVDPEQEVRLTAQEVLQRKLMQRDGKTREPVWAHHRLNLRNAYLSGIDFSDCHLVEADFNGATFSGHARFSFSVLDWITFEDAAFTGNANFESVTFTGSANFARAAFTEEASFVKTVVGGLANFTDSTFSADANFYRTNIDGLANFTSTTFSSGAEFGNAAFYRASFTNATFATNPTFEGASFDRDQEFDVTPEGWRRVTHPGFTDRFMWRFVPDRPADPDPERP
ncbi:pentapeptide repeat-containing protein [Glycomyces sp. MUSA5-2]|uniref:pentapeptide repeat-containing protein n=1 Tax=Glycomyces sp. MUSA5-2 TaxID=2053002 RepID=UPI00300A198B